MDPIRLEAALIFIGGLLLFTMGLSSQEIIGFESRFYLFALEMWRHGPSWFPMTYHQPYADYPATSTGLIYFFSKCVGTLNKFTAVFPSALAAAITLSVTYLIGALHSRMWGIGAALFLLFTAMFLEEARTISLDQFITAITAICFYLIYSAGILQKPRRYLWIFPLFVLGFSFRGPLGLVIPAGVVSVFYLLEKDVKRFLIVGLAAAFLLAVCTALLLALAYHAGGMEFVHAVLNMEVIGRLQESKTPRWYFYFVESLGAYAVSYPLAMLILLGLRKEKNSDDIQLIKKLTGWVLVILIGLSVPADKKIRYILAISPALALICGYLFVAGREQKYLVWLRWVFLCFCAVFPLLCLMAVFYIHHRYPHLYFFNHTIIIFFSMMQMAIIFLWRSPLYSFLFSVMSFILVLVFVIEPINLDINQTRDFVRQIEKVRLQEHAKLVFYRLGKDGLVIKYLANMPIDDDNSQVVFINQKEELQHINYPAVIVTTKEIFQQSFQQEALLEVGSLGHEPAVAFSKNVFHQGGVF